MASSGSSQRIALSQFLAQALMVLRKATAQLALRVRRRLVEPAAAAHRAGCSLERYP
jgi:hypothetical protein